ncbi:response regulator [Natroniella sulfidigena]|uniref:response regulator n=1 Tax=Natroniella sulfidigena TaxID=723921 RepID=UPI00200AA3F1|nr:response regulator [Natroniella sulfidigena]MCK8817516.1 response regulator [Natroniella sulfidigena]
MKEEIKVLIVEDDPMVSHINRRYTEKISDFVVLKEVNFDQETIVAEADLQEADLLLLDIYLPIKDGITLLKEIRSSDHDIDVIIISAAKDADRINKAMQLGVIDYLIKPFTFDRFKDSLLKYKRLRTDLGAKSSFKQEEVDQLLDANYELQEGDSSSKEEINFARNLPKGLNNKTLDKIKEFMLNEADEFTTKKIAEKINLSRVTVQRYLKYMADIGMVELRREYGTVGRPRHYYKLVD